MERIRRLYMTGYRNYELNIFQESDPKISIIKQVINSRLLPYLEAGLEWVLLTGNLGVDVWAVECLWELQKVYPNLNYAIIAPYLEFDKQWNKKNKEVYKKMRDKANFFTTLSNAPYTNPRQLRFHTQFILQHTEGSLLLYDEEFEGKPHFFYQDANRYQKIQPYSMDLITMFDLENYLDSFD